MSCPVVVSGGKLRCSMGSSPGAFTGGSPAVSAAGRPAGRVIDFAMGANIAPFGQCMSLANPAVAAATAAALGVLTPQPCTPAVAGPWSPGAKHVFIDHQAALLSTDTASCAFAGVVTVIEPGQQVAFAV